MKSQTLVTLVATSLLAACVTPIAVPTPTPSAQPELAAAKSITAAGLLQHIKVISSDDFGGRSPGTEGESKTVSYLTEQFSTLGLQPGNPNGRYVQDVPLVGITSTSTMSFTVGKKKKLISLTPGVDFVASSARITPNVSVQNSRMIFVGYGVQAPEYDWDDIKGLDVRGNTLVMLINDPQVMEADNPNRLDNTVFKGAGMTYYGRWTYKYEMASRLKAAAAIIIHETVPAAYPWSVVQHSWNGEKFELAAKDDNMSQVGVRSWITVDKARELFKASGLDFDELHRDASSPQFQPVSLDAHANISVHNELRSVNSHNIVARLPGSDPTLKDEQVIYTAHWDHFGTDPKLQGDQIFNGAVDNASGVAGLLELAKAYAALPIAPKRSILFMSVTAEEQGLLGSRYYAREPLYPLTKTTAVINMDSLNPWGPTTDIQVTGSGQTTIEDQLAIVSAAHNRIVKPDAHPEKGNYFRSDHFEFAKVGVPGLYACRGETSSTQPAGWLEAKSEAYTANDYHNVSDEVKPDWDLSGAAADLVLLFETGYRVAQAPGLQQWKPGSEFKAIREQALAK